MEDFRVLREHAPEALLRRTRLPFDVLQVQRERFVETAHLVEDCTANEDESAFDGIERLTRNEDVAREAPAGPPDPCGADFAGVGVALEGADKTHMSVVPGGGHHSLDRGCWHDKVRVGKEDKGFVSQDLAERAVVRDAVPKVLPERAHLDTEAASHVHRAVRGSVVNDDEPRRSVCRRLQRPKARFEPRARIVREHDDQDGGRAHGLGTEATRFEPIGTNRLRVGGGCPDVRTAIVATVRNEAARIGEFLGSLEAQTRKPDVIVVTDGGSADGTQKALADFAARTSLPFRWIEVPGNRSRGRNAAIESAQADAVAMTDASVLDPSWFEKIIAPIEAGTADLVSGWFELRTDDARERCIGLLTQYSLDQIDPARFLPSSRSVAFTRDLWQKAGRYPEAYSGNEDTIFDLAMERQRPRKAFVKEAVVRWRPAPSVRVVYRQYERYAEGDGQGGVFLTKETRYLAYYAVYGGGLVLLVLGGFWWPAWALALAAAVAYTLFRVRKVIAARMGAQVPYAILVVVAWDLGRIVGYTKGRLDRLRRGRAYYRF